MNSYGLPDHVDEFYALQQVAYDHRVHANILHYSHHTAAPGARKSNLDMRLRSGRRMDNKRYDGVEPARSRPIGMTSSKRSGRIWMVHTFKTATGAPFPRRDSTSPFTKAGL